MKYPAAAISAMAQNSAAARAARLRRFFSRSSRLSLRFISAPYSRLSLSLAKDAS